MTKHASLLTAPTRSPIYTFNASPAEWDRKRSNFPPEPWFYPKKVKEPRNMHICQRCGQPYYRRTGNNPQRITKYCSNDCKFRRHEPPPAPTLPADFVLTKTAGERVGYSASQVRRLAAAKKIDAVQVGRGKFWRVSISSLRGYIAAAG